MTIFEMLQNVRSINLTEEVPKIIEQTSYEITVLNQEQMYSGFDSNGNKIGAYRSKPYSEKKQIKNPKPGFGVPDLFVNGSFYKGMGVIVRKDTFEGNSVDVKTEKLIKDYGEDIFGLYDENKGKYANETLFGRVKDYITAKTGLR